MKDQPANRLKMEDLAVKLEKQGTGKKGKIIIPDNELYVPDVMKSTGETQEQKDRIEYNKNIENHLDEYLNFEPTRKIVVRCFVMEYYEQNGILQIPDIQVPVRTANGVGHKEFQKSPWPYSRKAVIVAVPKNHDIYKPGDIVLLERGVTLTAPKQNSEMPFHMPKAFTTDSWNDMEPPHSMKSEHYGYLILEPLNEILGIKK